MKKLTNKKGFTLTELIVVIVIIGILAAVLIPNLTAYINKARQSAAEQEATTVVREYNHAAAFQGREAVAKVYFLQDGYYVAFENGSLKTSSKAVADMDGYAALTIVAAVADDPATESVNEAKPAFYSVAGAAYDADLSVTVEF